MGNHIRLETDASGIALITIDLQGRSVNVFTPEFTQELQEVADQVTSRPEILGAILTSGKSSGFLAGADLTAFVHVHDQGLSPSQAAGLVADAGKAMRDLERCGKPVAVAINGLALGGGYELCLACHHRVLVDHPKAVVGLPEVSVGLLPAGGGTQRLPRLIGIPKALPLLLSGRHIGGAEALSLGLVDALADASSVVEVARQWVLANPGFQQPWDRKGFKVPAGAGALAPHAMDSFSTGMARIRRDTQDNFPAPAAILSSVYEGTLLPMDRALEIERKHFGELLAGPVARNLMRTLFLNKGAARKLIRRPQGIPKSSVRRLGILGAGMMGSGIASVAAASGIETVLLDMSQASAEAGKAKIAAIYARDVKAGRRSASEAEGLLARITATDDYRSLAGCDFVVEAVFEDREVKAQALERARVGLGTLSANFVMASNTSTLPVSGLATLWPHPTE